MEWEYITREWSFVDAVEDEWPKRREYAEKMLRQLERKQVARAASHQRGVFDQSDLVIDPLAEDIVDGPEGEQLIREYLRWRLAEEATYLNEFGAAGFELVSITRHQSPLAYRMPPVDVFAYFKRPKAPDLPAAPSRPIGFRRADQT